MKIVITVKDTDNVIGLKEDIAMRLDGVADILRIDTADVVPKSEVKRIFEEIEKFDRRPIPESKAVYVIKESEFAELKKKYTEET